MGEQYTNTISTNLTADVTTTSQTTLTVSSVTGFPTTGNFRVLVGSEIMLVTSVNSGALTFTVTRAVENTFPSTYTAGTTVDHILTAGALDAIRADMSSSGPFASLPASGTKVGDLYIPTDSFYDFLRWNGSSWDYFRNGRTLIPPVAAQFTTDNAGNAVVDTTHGGLIWFETPATAGTIKPRYKAVPATPYTIYMGFLPHYQSNSGNSNGCGMIFRSSTGQLITYGTCYPNAWNLRYYKWNSAVSFNADYQNQAIYPGLVHGPIVWLGIRDDGTTRSALWSGNGINWSTYHSITRTDFFTPAFVGFYIGDQPANVDSGITVLHWQATSP